MEFPTTTPENFSGVQAVSHTYPGEFLRTTTEDFSGVSNHGKIYRGVSHAITMRGTKFTHHENDNGRIYPPPGRV